METEPKATTGETIPSEANVDAATQTEASTKEHNRLNAVKRIEAKKSVDSQRVSRVELEALRSIENDPLMKAVWEATLRYRDTNDPSGFDAALGAYRTRGDREITKMEQTTNGFGTGVVAAQPEAQAQQKQVSTPLLSADVILAAKEQEEDRFIEAHKELFEGKSDAEIRTFMNTLWGSPFTVDELNKAEQAVISRQMSTSRAVKGVLDRSHKALSDLYGAKSTAKTVDGGAVSKDADSLAAENLRLKTLGKIAPEARVSPADKIDKDDGNQRRTLKDVHSFHAARLDAMLRGERPGTP